MTKMTIGYNEKTVTVEAGTRSIRVDEEVYRLLQAKKHELEKELGRAVPMTDAVKALLDANLEDARNDD
jgi:hypothetical protein